MTARGEQYLTITDVQSYDYDGLFLYLKRPPRHYYSEISSCSGTRLPRSTTERVITDPKTFMEEIRDQKDNMARFEERCEKSPTTRLHDSSER